jgi:hypothetical protein
LPFLGVVQNLRTDTDYAIARCFRGQCLEFFGVRILAYLPESFSHVQERIGVRILWRRRCYLLGLLRLLNRVDNFRMRDLGCAYNALVESNPNGKSCWPISGDILCLLDVSRFYPRNIFRRDLRARR